jgi:hypothetical protein
MKLLALILLASTIFSFQNLIQAEDQKPLTSKKLEELKKMVPHSKMQKGNLVAAIKEEEERLKEEELRKKGIKSKKK